MKWPKVIREAYAKVWSGKYTRVIIKAPRGGGKSKMLGTIGFDLWYLRNRSVVNMAGSFAQAQIVYDYFTDYSDIDPLFNGYIDGSVTMNKVTAKTGNFFSCITASPKQARGKHPDVFISDETCETSDELIHSALPMVNDSAHPLVIMASTFHKIFGIFQETWDEAEERGYLRIQWDIFDVCKPFPADYWDQPDIKKITGIERLMKHAKGRTGDPDGWIPIDNIVQGWKEKPTEDWFEVEYLGSRPSTAGLVLKPEDVDRSVIDTELDKRFDYVRGATCVIGIDWGFSTMTAVVEGMLYKDATVVILNNKNYHQVASDDIIAEVMEMVRAHGIRVVYADSAGKFENVALRNALAKAGIACAVIEVVFGVDKEAMLGNLRAHFEQGKIKLPKKLRDAYWQYKRYRYQEGSDKPVKKDDHIPDATMCMLQHFKLGIFARSLPKQEEAKKEHTKPITAGLMKKTF